MGFFQKIEFDAWLISSTIELTRVQVLGRSCAWLWRYSALFAIAPIIEKLWSKGVAMHAYGVSAYHRDPEMDLGGAVRNERKDRARVEFR